MEKIEFIEIDSFEISKYPITNQQFKEFVDDGGYKNPDLWSAEGCKWLKDYEIELHILNYPIVGVSWYEADAFCKWLTISKDDGYTYQLPDEKQWQVALERLEYSRNRVPPTFSIDNVGFRCIRIKAEED